MVITPVSQEQELFKRDITVRRQYISISLLHLLNRTKGMGECIDGRESSWGSSVFWLDLGFSESRKIKG